MARKDRKSPERSTPSHMWDHVYAGPATAPFPPLLSPPKTTQDSPSAFRRLAKIPSWVRGHKRSAPRSPSNSLSPSSTTAFKHSSVSTYTRDTVTSVSSTVSPLTIPSSPTHPPPIRPRLTCRSLGVSTRADLPKLDRATTTTPDSFIDPNIIQEQHRRRSLSSPQIPTSPTQKKPALALVPRSAVVTHSWGELEKDESRVKKSKERIITPPPARTPESPTTVACRQLGTFTSWEFPNSEDVSPACSSTILPTHFESITQLNLKLSAGEELTIEELMRGLKDAFARYYSVLDTAAELKRKYEGENEGLRMKVGVMEEQKRRDDAELKRLRKALREGRERDEDDSDRRERPQTANTKRPISWQADNGNNVNLRRTKTSNVQSSATATTTTSRPSLTITLDPGPPPAGPLPPIPCNQGVLMTPVSPAFKFEGRRRRVTVPVPGPTSST